MSDSPSTDQPVEGAYGAPITGPQNPARQRQNPDELAPPLTDHGLVPNLKFSFADTHVKLSEGGWAREITVRELPVATAIAGVNMHLSPGSIRELHWHVQAELGYVLKGSCRISAVNSAGQNFVDDVGEGDLWNFAKGVPHSIQALGDGCEFLLMFDDGSQSEFTTSLLSDMIRSMPEHVIETSLGVPVKDLSKLPAHELYIFESEVPGLLENDRIASPDGRVQNWLSHNLSNAPAIDCQAGTIREITQADFPAMDTMSIEEVTIEPGAMRTLHWHPEDEWQYYLEGSARVTVFMPQGGSSATFDFQAGDVGYIPGIAAHYVENTGTVPLRFLGTFRKPEMDNFSFGQWMALTPMNLVQANLGLSDEAVASLAKGRRDIVPIKGNRKDGANPKRLAT